MQTKNYFSAKRFLRVLALLVAIASSAAADDRGGFAGKADVIGYWTMIPWSPELAAMNRTDPWPQPFQYFAYYENGEMFSHMSTHATDHTPESLDTLHGMLPHTVHFHFDTDGFMVVEREDDPDNPEKWGVNLIAKDFSSGGTDFKTGDLVMSLDDGQGNVVYRRLLRRIAVEE